MKLTGKLLLLLLTWSVAVLSPESAWAQSLKRMQQCNVLLAEENYAAANAQWERLIAKARDELMLCRDLMDRGEEASTLHYIGIGLNQLGKYEDAVPVLRRCVSLKPDAAYCWAQMGRSYAELGQLQEARDSFRKAIAIGGYDTLNANAVEWAKKQLAALEAVQVKPPPSDEPATTGGTGFFVTNQGHILTNSHVVSGCRSIVTSNQEKLWVIGRSQTADLAVLKGEVLPQAVATFRSGLEPRLGDSVIVFGFPLQGLLSPEGNVSTGTISAMAGIRNDPQFIQISAPVQPGNSGGPLLDHSGNVIGVVVAKLDAVKVAQVTGDIPQNVNFAVRWSEIVTFLDSAHISYRRKPSAAISKTADIAQEAKRYSVAIQCTKSL